MDLSQAVWRKASYSSTGDNCIEVASNLHPVIAVRDSKDPSVGAHVVTPDTWRTFVNAVRSNQF